MSRFVLLDCGEELTEATAKALRAAASPVPLRLLKPAPPFRDHQVVHVQPIERGAPRSGDIILRRTGGDFVLCAGGHGPADAAGEILGRVVAIRRGPTTASLERGLLARLPWRWRPPAVDLLEVLARLRHPLTPSLFQGTSEACLAGVRAKYGSAAEVRGYVRHARSGVDPLELSLVGRHVKAGGRLLDIGCGAGREALGFARAGFRVVGIDIASAMIAAARENAARAGLGVEFRVQSATELDDLPGSFDGAFLAGAFEHIPSRALRIATLGRVKRALTSDGALILGVTYRQALGLLSRARVVDVLRRFGIGLVGRGRVSEPGDGWMRDVSDASDPRVLVFFHSFSSSAEVRLEIEAARLAADEPLLGWWVCRPA